MPLRAVAEINLAAIERNLARLSERLAPGTELCAVVKANAYGHGAAPVARAALKGGASAVAVVSAGEALELREAGVEGRIIVLGAISDAELALALAAGGELTVWDRRFVQKVRDAAGHAPVRLHVKLDSGMGRLGTRDLDAALDVVDAVLDAAPVLELAALTTHFATSDGDLDFARQQLAAFLPFVAAARERAGRPVPAHAANSGAVLRLAESHLDMVRTGIAMYGADPMNADPAAHGLEPALALRSYVAAVKPIAPGQSTGYGRRHIAAGDSWIATVPIGYADGVNRGLTNNADVLIGGRRYPLVGTVSMDNITVDVGADPTVSVGDVVTLIGSDGTARQTAEDLAQRLNTINYEVLCWISRRVRRRYHRDGAFLGDPAE